MKTPEEIKLGLEHCASYKPCIQCDYDARDWPRCVTRLHGDGIAYIQQLEQDNAQKDERIRQLEREKEALSNIVKRTHFACLYCKYNSNGCTRRAEEISLIGDCFEWRGVEEDEV